MKYGFIFGDFDVFRINDLQKIQNEKKKCEFLIVGVFSD